MNKVLKRLISFLSQFNRERRGIKRGLKQAEMIHAGKLKGKSFEDFLNEIDNNDSNKSIRD